MGFSFPGLILQCGLLTTKYRASNLNVYRVSLIQKFWTWSTIALVQSPIGKHFSWNNYDKAVTSINVSIVAKGYPQKRLLSIRFWLSNRKSFCSWRKRHIWLCRLSLKAWTNCLSSLNSIVCLYGDFSGCTERRNTYRITFTSRHGHCRGIG